MTWEVVAGLIALVSAGIGAGKIVYELSRTLTKLNCSLTALTTENREEHDELYGGVAELQEVLQTQDIRLAKLEERVKK